LDGNPDNPDKRTKNLDRRLCGMSKRRLTRGEIERLLKRYNGFVAEWNRRETDRDEVLPAVGDDWCEFAQAGPVYGTAANKLCLVFRDALDVAHTLRLRAKVSLFKAGRSFERERLEPGDVLWGWVQNIRYG